MRPRAKLIVLVRDPVERYESARRMYLCFAEDAQRLGEQFHAEGAMDAYLEAEMGGGGKRRRSSEGLPLRRGLYMVRGRVGGLGGVGPSVVG